VVEVEELLFRGHPEVVDADLELGWVPDPCKRAPEGINLKPRQSLDRLAHLGEIGEKIEDRSIRRSASFH
jgi:hypothetical protein